MKKHVGRPSNKELRARKNKMIFTVAISVVFVLLIVGLFETGSLSNLMGNSVTEYYCEDGYKLKGDKCVKTVREKAYKIGDVNKDNKLNVNDVTEIQRYLAEFITFDDYQMTLADVNQDGGVNVTDVTILQRYLSNSFSGTMSAEHHIGERICPKNSGYVVRNYCDIDVTVDAMTKVREVDYQMGDKVTYKGIDFYVIENTDKDSEYVNLLKSDPLTNAEVMKFGRDYLDGGVKFFSSDNCNIDNQNECSNYYDASYVKKIVDGWANRYIDSDDLSANNGARLLDWNIVNDLSQYQDGRNKVLYSWLIANGDYWVMNAPMGDNRYYAGVIDKMGNLTNNSIDSYNKVRPVITLKKSAIGKEKEKVDYAIGNKVKYNKRSYYVLNDSLESEDYVTLTTLMPLTRTQLTTYTKDMNIEVSGFTYNNYGSVSYGNDTSFENSNVKQIVDKWAKIVAKRTDLVPDSTGYSVRILSYYDDLIDKVSFAEAVGDLGKIDLSWLKNECWTMTPSTFENEYNYMIVTGNNNISNLPATGSGTVCPVITIKKSALK